MAYQRRKRRFDRKKVVLVERTICILILLALLALAGRWIAGQLSKEDSQKKKQTKTLLLDQPDFISDLCQSEICIILS